MNLKSNYADSLITLTTKHSKSDAIAPIFNKIHKADVKEYHFDTDTLGTFSGEIQRTGSILDCAKKKCQLGIKFTQSLHGLASEGSFGPHPFVPFIPCNYEILYFIDNKLDFHLDVSFFTEKTNFSTSLISSYTQLKNFAKTVKFPSHSLILRPDNRHSLNPIFKGIQTFIYLKFAYDECIKSAKDKTVFVETDMRANQNPTRMDSITQLAKSLAIRLDTLCPKCMCPGWGKVNIEQGLPCVACKIPSDVIKFDVFGCPKCVHKEKRLPSHGLTETPQENCKYCNP